MKKITIIRHGQANVGAKSEADYDRLSDLGRQQAAWSGEYFQQVGKTELIVSGTMQRQKETADGTNFASLDHMRDARFNEMQYFDLAKALETEFGHSLPAQNTEFPAFIQKVVEHWDVLAKRHNLEPYAEFRNRVKSALLAAARQADHVLVVSSGGVIASLANIALNLPKEESWRMFTGIAHTSQHEFLVEGDELHLMQYGAVPHLDRPDRRDAITYV